MFRLLGLLAALLCVTPAAAKETTASELLNYCELLERTWTPEAHGAQLQQNMGIYCWGLLGGFLDVAYIRYQEKDGDPIYSPLSLMGICVPSGVGRVQFVRMFLQYAHTHPAELHQGEIFMVVNTLKAGFPCQKPDAR
jgi:hypothetical protein